MKRISILTLLFITGCNPIPVEYKCDIPVFKINGTTHVIEKYDTSSFFGEYCPTEIPEIQTIDLENGNLEVYIKSYRMYFVAHNAEGETLNIKGNSILAMPNVGVVEGLQKYTNHTSVELSPSPISIEIYTKSGIFQESLSLHYKKLQCTCYYYDAL